jgi:hypothetical protein
LRGDLRRRVAPRNAGGFPLGPGESKTTVTRTTPPGYTRGRKTGWNGATQPPSQIRRAGGASFVRQNFGFTGKVQHDTNLLRRSLTMIRDDGVRVRIDVPKNAFVYDARTGKKLSVHELHDGDIIRVLGVQTDVKRWEANRIELTMKD